MYPHHQRQRVELLHDALKEKAPKTYQDLKAKGQLWPFLEEREQEMHQAFLETFEIQNQWKREHRYLERQGRGLEFLQRFNRLINRLGDETIATFTEFADFPEDEDDD